MNELQDQLKLLAERAGYEVNAGDDESSRWQHGESFGVYYHGQLIRGLPAPDERLTDAECWVVTKWLKAAGYVVMFPQDGIYNTSVHLKAPGKSVTHVAADSPEATLNEALVAAVLALPLGEDNA